MLIEHLSQDPVGRRLREDLEVIDLAGFMERFYSQTLTWRLEGYAAIANDPGLIGRIRGSFGQTLIDGASRRVASGLPCNWNPPCAAEVIWRKHGQISSGIELPAPWIIQIDPKAGDLDVKLTLFGFACDFMPATAEAMTNAMQTRIDWKGTSGLFLRSPEILGRHLSVVEGLIGDAPQCESIVLDFISPATISKGSPLLDPMALFTMLPWRIAGLARWHGFDIDVKSMPDVRDLFERVSWQWSDASSVSWYRGSKRQDREIPLEGVFGELQIDGDSEDISTLWPLIVLGERTHVGADIAFGCGRYEISRVF